MHPESPNGLWHRLGYTIERGARKNRTIINAKGQPVPVTRQAGEDWHQAEIRTAKALLPHGEAECKAAQLSLL